MKRETRKPKRLRKMTAVTMALVCTLAGVNIANATDVTTQSELQDILNSGGTATVTKDITLSSSLTNSSATSAITIVGDIAGRYISGDKQWQGFQFKNNDYTISDISNLTLKDMKSATYTGGGAIANYISEQTLTSTITNINADFIGNSAILKGGAISNYSGSVYANKTVNVTIDKINGIFNKNSADKGGAISNAAENDSTATVHLTSEISHIGTTSNHAQFISNSATNGGAIYNLARGHNSNATISDINADFIGNTATSKGGAIYNEVGTTGTATITLNDVVFKNNYSNWNGTTGTLNDIYNIGIVNVAGNVYMTGGITDATTPVGTTNITSTGTLKLANGATLQQGTVTLNGTLDLANGAIDTITTGGTLTGTGGLRLDIIGDNIDNITVTGGDASGIKISALNLHNAPVLGAYTYLTGATSNTDDVCVAIAETIGNNNVYRFTNTGGQIKLAGSLNKTLHEIVTDTFGGVASKVVSWSITDPSTTYEIGADGIGTLTWKGGEPLEDTRDSFTIFGNGGTINGNNHAGITIDSTANKTVAIEDVTMTGFNKTSSDSSVNGGAIDNSGTITTISGKYTANHITSTGNDAYGGAISNRGTITNLNADFDSNTATSDDSALGGAIYNESGTITNISGNYTTNNVNSSASYALGGAIYNNNGATITNINSDFTGNYTLGTISSKGGAIYNESGATITNINSDFTGNYTSGNDLQGGAIYNMGTIGDTTNSTGGIGTADNYATFTGNGIKLEELETKYGGAIFNAGTITNIYAGFDHNAVTDNGGAIYNLASKTINFITGDFDGNIADGNGGAIYNAGTIGDTTNSTGGIGTVDNYATFTGNGIKDGVAVTKQGGAIYNKGTITNIYADFDGNKATSSGGAIYNNGTSSTSIGNIVGTFTNNEATNGGGAICNQGVYSGNSATISKIDADFTGNKVALSGGAIFNRANGGGVATISEITGEFDGNIADENGGAIYNEASNGSGSATISLIDNATFKDNYATLNGGAIYNYQYGSTATITLKDVIFTNNYIGTENNPTSYNDIYNTGTINITGNTSMTGGITGTGTTNIASTGILTLKHAFDADGNDKGLATLTQGEINVENGGIIDLQNGKIDTLDLANLKDGAYATFNLDFDGSKSAGSNIDKINIALKDNTGAATAKVNAIKITGDATQSGTTSTTATWLEADWEKITDATTIDVMKSATENYLYKFQKNGDGAFDVTMTEIVSLTLPEVVHNADYAEISSYSITQDTYTLNDNLGNLAGDGRSFTIFGNNHTIDGNSNAGIFVNSGQTFALEDATMKNFIADGEGYGGVIYNNGTIDTLSADFIDNTAINRGGAIYNEANANATTKTVTISDITGNFTGNSAYEGGAIYNYASAYAESEQNAQATAKIENITGTFTKNNVISKTSEVSGGAIYNRATKGLGGGSETATATIGLKNVTFSGNYAQSGDNTVEPASVGTNAYGGAIYNIGDGANITITGTNVFENNYATTNTEDGTKGAYGGAIYNGAGATMDITGTNTFKGNYAESPSHWGQGGAIFNKGTIGNVSDNTGGIGTADNYAIFTGNGIKTDGETKTVVTDNGGAIFNGSDATITNIYADFDGNSAWSGGAIFNRGKITKINGDFTDNYAGSGGAINNESGTIGDTSNGTGGIGTEIAKATFTGNDGGAIYNDGGAITNIYADFTNNNISTYSPGGAIVNYTSSSTINYITGNFTGNSTNDTGGGAIYNVGTIGYDTDKGGIGSATQKATFSKNYVEVELGSARGGAIYNKGTITNIYADFDGNKATNGGGAIANIGTSSTTTIGNIVGTFTNNEVQFPGGAIYNEALYSGNSATISKIDADFTGNKSASMDGGAISNYANSGGVATISEITGEFKENTAVTGGAISNSAAGGSGSTQAIITMIDNAVFKDNSATSLGGAIFNNQNAWDTGTAYASIAISDSTFTGNYVQGSIAQGGAIYNQGGTITLDNVTFTNNTANGVLNDIYNTGTLNIAGDVYMTGGITTELNDVGTPQSGKTVIGSSTGSESGYLKLGEDATLNQATIEFYNNSTIDIANGAYNTIRAQQITGSGNIKMDLFKTGTSTSNDDIGTGVTGSNTTLTITALNIHNELAKDDMFRYMNGPTNAKTGTFKAAAGDKIYTFDYYNNVNLKVTNVDSGSTIANAIDNAAISYSITEDATAPVDFGGYGLADPAELNNDFTIYGNGGTIDGGEKMGMKLASGKTLDIQDVTMQNFKADSAASVIENYNDATTGTASNPTVSTVNINNVIFKDNISTIGTPVLNNSYDENNIAVINIANSRFENNTVTTASGAGAIGNSQYSNLTITDSTFLGNTVNGTPNDIVNQGDLTFIGVNSLDGGITEDTGSPTGRVYVGNGYTETTVTLGNDATLEQNEVILNHNATLNLGTKAADDFGVNTFTVNGCALSIQNASINNFAFNNLVLNDPLTMMVDADLANEQMDTISLGGTLTGTNQVINVSNIRLLSDATKTELSLPFADDNLKGIVNYTGGQGISYSPLYKYNVAYDSTNGEFAFTRFGGGNSYSSYNPSVFASGVGALVGSYLSQLNMYDQAFGNMDMTMTMTKEQRQARKFANKYAAADINDTLSFQPSQMPEEYKGIWFKPYASFENVNLNGGPSVNNITYGTLVGGDTQLFDLPHGWEMNWGAYAAYNGSYQQYEGTSIYQNGGSLGLNAALYKGNYFLGVTGNVGANVGQASTTFGPETFTTLATGIAAKTGYNWELFNSKLIVQPNFLISYSFMNTFDYTSASGLRMSQDPLNAIQLAPGLKLIGNLPKGWQPYLSVQMMWNLLGNTNLSANNVSLPQLSVDPYVQYGLGVQRSWGGRFTGFGQAMMRNGGRNGVALQFGFRYALGTEGDKIKKGQAPKSEGAKIQLTSAKK